MIPEPIKKFVEKFSALPSIGPRQATRLGFYIKSLGDAAIKELADAITGLEGIKTCSKCFFSFQKQSKSIHLGNSDEFVASDDLCDICSNPQRRKDLVAVVEKETDLISLEKTKKFNGRYLVLGELQKDGTLDAVQRLRLKSLKNDKLEEIILAINPTTYGDLNAGLIEQELKGIAKKMTRLGRGIPTGGEIEFADEDTLGSALDNRN